MWCRVMPCDAMWCRVTLHDAVTLCGQRKIRIDKILLSHTQHTHAPVHIHGPILDEPHMNTAVNPQTVNILTCNCGTEQNVTDLLSEENRKCRQTNKNATCNRICSFLHATYMTDVVAHRVCYYTTTDWKPQNLAYGVRDWKQLFPMSTPCTHSWDQREGRWEGRADGMVNTSHHKHIPFHLSTHYHSS